MAELKAKGNCDFCGETCNADMYGARAYDCGDFPMPITGATSHGAWGACSCCAALIDGERWDSLEERMTVIHSRRFGLVAEVVAADAAADVRATDSVVPAASHSRSRG